MVTKLEHEVQLPFPAEHLDQVHQVGVLEVLEHPDLPERYLLDQRIVLTLHELLDGHEVSGVPRPALVHHAVAALAYLTQLLIPGNDVRMRKIDENKYLNSLTAPLTLTVLSTLCLLYCESLKERIFNGVYRELGLDPDTEV